MVPYKNAGPKTKIINDSRKTVKVAQVPKLKSRKSKNT